ncbi:hypothetical protein EGW08_002291 [Elysia chlorotica]|uniref:Corticotropin-releasing factor domain-containing protein n=1 Tax=Elysia chlorotica TaxID=188477 RepID=A0A433U810_ELYCH|nr:hypothetical protein EGW08_002291 [Elysia chlorotica]
MDATKALCLVCLLVMSLAAQWSLALPLVQGGAGDISLALDPPFRLARSAKQVETADPAHLAPHQAFLSRMRRSLAQMYAGSLQYNSHHHSGRRRERRMHHRHHRHHRRHRGRVVDA